MEIVIDGKKYEIGQRVKVLIMRNGETIESVIEFKEYADDEGYSTDDHYGAVVKLPHEYDKNFYRTLPDLVRGCHGYKIVD